MLYNAWMLFRVSHLEAGAQAIATSSWAVAEAQGYRDGEAMVELVEQIVARIAGTIDVPVTMDFEGGYCDDDQVLAANVFRLLALGVVGMNFEDRVVKGVGLYAVDRQAHRPSRRFAARPSRASTSSSTRGQTCFWVSKAIGTVGRRGSGARPEGVRQRWCVRFFIPWFAGRCTDRPHLRWHRIACQCYGDGRCAVK